MVWRLPSVQCMRCQRFRGIVQVPVGPLLRAPRGQCDAFTDAIPTDIWQDRFDHRKPHAGDNGLRFLADPGERSPFAE